jgi:hypothetical protein
VLPAAGIFRDKREVFALCLSDQHPVERVTVDRRESSGRDGMLEADGQGSETLSAVMDPP